MRLVFLSLLLLPIAAQAAPAIAVISAFMKTYAVYAAIAQVVLAVGTAIYGAAQRRKAERRAKDAYNASLKDRTITRIATEAPHRYVYGRARVGSDIVAMFASGSRDEYKHIVCVHAAHECEAIEEVYINGTALGTLDAEGFVTGGEFFSTSTENATEVKSGGSFTLAYTPIAGTVKIASYVNRVEGQREMPSFTVVGNAVTMGSDYTGGSLKVTYQFTITHPKVRVRKHLGTASDTADASLLSEVPSKWEANKVLRGLCYTVIRLDLNQPEFQGGIPSIEVLLKGKKIYDLRTGVTAWSENNALVIYDYLISEICGVDAADLPAAQFIAAANVCDEAQSFGKRYTFNGAITSDEDQKSVLERMAQSMAGSLVSTAWDIYAGKYVAPVMALEQTDIVGSLAVNPGVSDADLYNGVRGQYISSETNYVADDFKTFQSSTYLAADGRDLYTNIDFPFTDSLQRVHNLCRIFTEDQRNGYTVKGEFSLKAWKLKVGNRVTLTSSLFGWSSKVFRVTDKKFSPNSAVELTLKEDAASIWDFADAVTADSTPNTNLQNPYAINKLASISCQSGTDALLLNADGTIVSRILATWPQATTQAVVTNGMIEIEWLALGSDVWQKTQVSGSDTQAYLSPVEDSELYTVRARCVNPYLNVKSDWVYATHTVIGKTEPPANILDLSISGTVLNWSEVSDIDLAGYLFRFHYGSNRDWGSAVPLHVGLITQSPFDLITRPPGTVTIMGKAIDTSGNESFSAAIIVTNLGDPEIANVVETIDFKAGGFAGVHAGCGIVGGNLVADNLDSAYGTDNQSAYGNDNDPFYEPAAYGQMIYTSDEVAIGSALAGSIMTILHATQGTDLIIEYRFVGPGAVYGADSDSAYGADSEPFYDPPGAWIPWPGQIAASNDIYQFRVTIGAGAAQGQITELKLVIDAPDIVEYLENVPINAIGTVVPYTKTFTSIKTVTPTLQANSSGAVTIEADKTSNLAPILKAYNSSHLPVSGATADIIVKGY